MGAQYSTPAQAAAVFGHQASARVADARARLLAAVVALRASGARYREANEGMMSWWSPEAGRAARLAGALLIMNDPDD